MGIRSAGERREAAYLDIGTKLSIADISLTLLGFGITVFAAFKAKKAAEAAEAASKAATDRILKADLHAELAAVLHLVEELKGLQRSKTVVLLAERYSALRNKVVAIRESKLINGEDDLTVVQDVIVRLKNLEKMILENPNALDEAKQLSRSNESLSKCSEGLLAVKERVRAK